MIKYSGYKETKFDEDWKVRIPEEWQKCYLKRFCKITSGSTPKGLPEYWNGNIKWVTPDDLGKNKSKVISKTARNITEEGYFSCGTKLIPMGSVVLSTRAPIGYSAIIGDEMCFNQGCKGITPNEKVSSDYIYYLVVASKEKLQALGNGTTFIELSRNALESFKGIFPSLPEQTQIARFLDHKTSQIDRLIAKKEELLKLLAEKRTALITKAVTKGLDPNVEMKDSGIDWLGEIPKHWSISKLKFLAYSNVEKLSEKENPDLELNYVEIGNVDLINGISFIEKVKFGQAPSRARRIARKGDLIISTVRTYLRSIAFIEKSIENLIVSTGFAVLRSRDNSTILPKYLGYCAQDQRFIEKVVSESEGVSYPATNPWKITEISIAYPDIEEQAKTIEYLDRILKKQDKLQNAIQSSIDMLKEYREALITAAVTGQIDVREEKTEIKL